MSESEWPYNLPIWRRAHRASSPDAQIVAEIDAAYEISMGNPTCGTLRLSTGLELERCNPSFIWSDDSRYLAVPRYFNRAAMGSFGGTGRVDVIGCLRHVVCETDR